MCARWELSYRAKYTHFNKIRPYTHEVEALKVATWDSQGGKKASRGWPPRYMLSSMVKLLSIEGSKAAIFTRHCRHYEDIALTDS
jgi:hypothetical protein